MSYYIGMDTGGTKTDIVLMDENHSIIAENKCKGVGSTLNSEKSKLPVVSDTITDMIRGKLININEINGVSVNLGGANVCQIKNTLESLFHESNIFVFRESEGIIPMYLSRLHDAQVIILAGTGLIGIGENPETKEKFVSNGWGCNIGDEGSGYYIGLEGIKASLRALEHRGPETMLSKNIFDGIGNIKAENDFRSICVLRDEVRGKIRPLSRKHIASYSFTVEKGAREGDDVCKEIFFKSGMWIAKTAYSVIRNIKYVNPSKICICGGLTKMWDLIEHGFRCFQEKNFRKWSVCFPKMSMAESAALYILQNEIANN